MSAIIIARDSHLRGKLSLLVRECGFQVTACEDDIEGLRQIASKTYSLAFFEITDQPADQLALIDKASRESPRTYRIAVTEEESNVSRTDLDEAGIHAVLAQPLDARMTLKQIERYAIDAEKRRQKAAQTAKVISQQPLRKPTSSPAGSHTKDTKNPSLTRGFLRLTEPPIPESATRSGTRGSITKPKAPVVPTYKPRYLANASKQSRKLIEAIGLACNFRQLVLLTGETGSEFELVARELHHCGGNDDYITMLPHTRIDEEELANLATLKRASLLPKPGIVYIERVEELSLEAREALIQFLDKMKLGGTPHIRFILSTATNSFFHNRDTHAWVSVLRSYAEHILEIHPLRERTEDIPRYLRLFLYYTTTIHPDFGVREIDKAAIDYLCQQIWYENFDGLRTILFKTCQSCKHNIISVRHLQGHVEEMREAYAEQLPQSMGAF